MQTLFSRILTAETTVQNAFRCHGPTRWWWRSVLWLHGKAAPVQLSPGEYKNQVTAGFHFYAVLYRFLSGILLVVSLGLLHVRPSVPEMVSEYAIAACGLGALVLWPVSSLGFAGARSWREGDDGGRIALLAFMVAVSILVAMFAAGVSVALESAGVLSPMCNLVGLCLFLLLGIGSYGIEIVFLATARELDSAK